MQALQVAHFADGLHPGIGHLAAAQIEPHDALGHGLQGGDLLVAEFLRRIHHVDLEPVIFGRDGHHGKVKMLGGGHHGIEPLLFHLGGEQLPLAHGPRAGGDGGGGLLVTGQGGAHGQQGGVHVVVGLEGGHRGVLGGAFVDPPADDLDLLGRHRLFPIRRHVVVVIGRQQHAHDQLALFGVAGHHRGVVGALGPGQHHLVGVEPQLAFDLVLIVTLVAFRLHDRHHEIGEHHPVGQRHFRGLLHRHLARRGGQFLGGFLGLRILQTGHHQGLERLRGILGQIGRPVDQRAAVVPGEAEHHHGHPQAAEIEQALPLETQDQRHKGQRAENEARPQMLRHQIALDLLALHQQIAHHRRADGAQGSEPQQQGHTLAQMGLARPAPQHLQHRHDEQQPDGHMDDQRMEAPQKDPPVTGGLLGAGLQQPQRTEHPGPAGDGQQGQKRDAGLGLSITGKNAHKVGGKRRAN